MTDLRKAAELALEALEDVFGLEKKDVAAIQALRQALAQPKREWVGLTDEELDEAMKYWSDDSRSTYGGAIIADGEYVNMRDTWRYIEAKLKEKNT